MRAEGILPDRLQVAGRRMTAGFTLVEALASLAFLSIVIPVAVQGLRIGNLAGQVAERKADAARIGDQVLSELIATRQWQQAASSGSVEEAGREFRWQLQTTSWNKEAMRQLTLIVTYAVQGQSYDVRLSTLVDPSAEL
jgi:type II secretory pathway pseudopilin PulG